MENNEILSRLMADGQPTTSEVKPVTSVVEEDLGLSTARVIAVRYKVSAFILLVLWIVVLLYAILPSLDSLQTVSAQVSAQQQTIDWFAAKKKTFEVNAAFVSLAQSSSTAIAQCVNSRIGCVNLDPKIKDNFALARSFLLLSDLYDSKMEINEQTLLKNINEYLLAGDSSSVQNISFGTPELIQGNLHSVPVQMRVEFPDKDTLFAFINRVDKEIPTSESLRVLYKLDEVSYDIMHYNESQTVDLSLHAFYYQQ